MAPDVDVDTLLTGAGYLRAAYPKWFGVSAGADGAEDVHADVQDVPVGVETVEDAVYAPGTPAPIAQEQPGVYYPTPTGTQTLPTGTQTLPTPSTHVQTPSASPTPPTPAPTATPADGQR